jgi:2,5-dichloro-2,5-cyclohexadiene-1,4-diol dehydrogenase 1
VQADVAREDAVRAMVQTAVATFGHLDGACNAAGVPPHAVPAHELGIEAWEHASAVNLRGAFLSLKYEVTAMLACGRGAIVNIASTAGVAAIPNAADYCATKAGVIGLSRGAAIDYARRGIRVNVVLPGVTRTPMLMGLVAGTPGMEAQVVEANPMGRMAEPDEIAYAIRWLLSDEASFVTGALLAADGGLTAM